MKIRIPSLTTSSIFMAVEEGICGDVSPFLNRNPLNVSKKWCVAFSFTCVL